MEGAIEGNEKGTEHGRKIRNSNDKAVGETGRMVKNINNVTKKRGKRPMTARKTKRRKRKKPYKLGLCQGHKTKWRLPEKSTCKYLPIPEITWTRNP